MRAIRIGTRTSALALEQARLVGEGIRACNPGLSYELVGYTTSGDRIQDRPLDEVGGKGLFVRELDRALAEGEVDIAAHSMKDLPAQLDPAVRIAALSPREDPFDVLVLPRGPEGGRLGSTPDPGDLRALAAWLCERSLAVGCSSARRRVQLLRLEPSLPVRPVRGNVNTRLEKLDRGEYGALVLAAAGLARLGLADRVDRRFSAEEMVPSAGQGVLAVTARADARLPWLDRYDDRSLERMCGRVERAFVQALDGDCTTPCGAYARVAGAAIELLGMYASPDGACVRTCRGRVVPDEGADARAVEAGLARQAASLARALLEGEGR